MSRAPLISEEHSTDPGNLVKYTGVIKINGLVKSPKNPFFVIPAEAGIQCL
jgi:hypothetical protein